MGQKDNRGVVGRIHRLSDEIFVSGAPNDFADVRTIADQGFRSVIDLRGGGEPIHGLSPEAEQEAGEQLGLAYEHLPLSVTTLTRATIDQVRLAIWAAEPPVLLHCGSGRRAWLCALLHLGCQHGWTVEECFTLASEHAIDMNEMPALRDFLCAYIERNSRAYLPINGTRTCDSADSYQI